MIQRILFLRWYSRGGRWKLPNDSVHNFFMHRKGYDENRTDLQSLWNDVLRRRTLARIVYLFTENSKLRTRANNCPTVVIPTVERRTELNISRNEDQQKVIETPRGDFFVRTTMRLVIVTATAFSSWKIRDWNSSVGIAIQKKILRTKIWCQTSS